MTFFNVEHCIRHHEWDEVIIKAPAFFDKITHMLKAATELGFIRSGERIEDLIEYPTLTFDHGHIPVDEMWHVKGQNVSISSGQSGVCEWSETRQAYIKSYYGRETYMGQFKSISFTKNEQWGAIVAWLEKNNAS